MIDLSKLEERVILAAVSTSETDQAESSLDELKELADTAGAKTVGRVIQNPDGGSGLRGQGDPEPGERSSGNLSGKGKASGTAGNAL